MTGLGATPLVALADSLSKTRAHAPTGLKFYIFSKHLQFLDYKNMSEAAKEMGFDGVDLTVRPKGHVLPENVTEDLPLATEAMRSFGLSTKMLTTRVTDAKNQLDRNVLQTASQYGYKVYRPGWYKYSSEKHIQESVQTCRNKLRALAQLGGDLGITGSYHNHSGHYFGAALWDLDQALEGLSLTQMGCQYDIMHATVEGGKNWQIGFRLIREHVNSLVVKDFKWGKVGGAWKPIHVPAGEGMVDFVSYFSLLKKNNINVPVSIHCEYDLGGAEHGVMPSIDHKTVFGRIQKDLQYYKDTWKKAG